MTQTLSKAKNGYLSNHARFTDTFTDNDSLWLNKIRQNAINKFEGLDFPSNNIPNEEWKYTNISQITKTPFETCSNEYLTKSWIESINSVSPDKNDTNQLVFLNGIFNSKLSSLSTTQPKIKVMSLKEAILSQSSIVEEHLSKYANYEDHVFTALNTAFITDGAFIYIPTGLSIETPINVIFFSGSSDQHLISHPRSLIVASDDTRASIIETYIGMNNKKYFTNAVSEIVVGERSQINHFRVQQHNQDAFHIGTTQVLLSHDSNFTSLSLDLGGALVRNNLNLIMGAERAQCSLSGLYMVAGSQHVDNHIVVHHEKPYTTSRQFYRGVLDGKSRAVFHGNISVYKDAQKVDARQEDKNLLLSSQAEADTKPAFWINANDVKCSHGAASSNLDETTLFYLRSRGIDEGQARRILVQGFAKEVIDSIAEPKIRSVMENLMIQKSSSFGNPL